MVAKIGKSDGKTPYREFPSFRQASGQRARKNRKRTHCFGVDAEKAVSKYLDPRDDLQAGRTPRESVAMFATLSHASLSPMAKALRPKADAPATTAA